MDSRIVQLAKQLLSNVSDLDAYIQSHNIPQPTYDKDGPLDYDLKSESADAARISAIENALELHDLLIGPTMILRPIVSLESSSYPSCLGLELVLTSPVPATSTTPQVSKPSTDSTSLEKCPLMERSPSRSLPVYVTSTSLISNGYFASLCVIIMPSVSLETGSCLIPQPRVLSRSHKVCGMHWA